ncbi:WapI family immunity protein [Litoreibacter halocynthiae]|uniref:WapI family immunity protein n=1 Tax=Litoreibacter halocynthiae TaxID=1242689 RepID=UPI00248F8793|nr:hypothetical protein [Litoreibacter halocynthiae]
MEPASETIIWDVFGLKIIVRGHQYPTADDYADANWLNVSVSYGANGANVAFDGPCLRTNEVASFLEQLEAMNTMQRGSARLNCMEPNIDVKISREGSLGGLSVAIDITPDISEQRHQFNSGSDLSYLPKIIQDGRKVLSVFPVKGDQNVH